MNANFDFSLARLLSPDREGGFSDDPHDPGGATNHGVTLVTWQEYLGRTVTVDEMRALTAGEVAPLYRHRYWEAAACDVLPSGLDHCVFDFAVNSGPLRARMALQSVARVQVDGKIGEITLTALEMADHAQLAHDYCALRIDFLRKNPNFDRYGDGWVRRVNEVEQEAKTLIGAKS